ncbi:flagellar hook-associated protein FlgL [Candidatus Magnetominusculus xianensis]|uniref:Flagellar hook protein FlgL n=1 Tax=Candidatus Magnetominusculus xianensis TaxID=1748249 RepID=A0ABR5SGB3_9BACT|nr:flagellar hook-associated protein FlgL [Candidatus Magnetominusculus xianensis]KWT85381.1 flagellar hook protein FlgL [Candidatus Magnetominusculus xianensis]MBF0405140.1 flagellar hook-associated protein FlgL [Nitrospirota bacterium]
MRISSFMYIEMMKKSFQDSVSQLFDSQEQLSSGLKINRPSDDISAMGQILGYKVDIANTTQYQKNISAAQSFLQTSDTSMSSVVENLQRIQELMVSGVNGSTDAAGRQNIAAEIATIKESLYSLSLTRLGNRYLFSGSQTYTASFALTGAAASAGGFYTYQGDSTQTSVNVNSTAQVIENISGSDAFAFSLDTTLSIRLTTGRFAHYIPTAGPSNSNMPSAIAVNISNSSSPTAVSLEQVSFSNYMDMVNIIETAFNKDDVDMINAMMKPLLMSLDKVVTVRATIGARLNFLQQTINNNDNNNVDQSTYLSNAQDADIAKVATDISKSEVALQALRQSSAQVMSQTLFDFLSIR